MTDTSTSIGGTVAPGYERVAEAFARNFSHHGDVGAALCVYRHGEVVADLWGGVEDPATGTPYGPDTLQLVFSSTKGATALCANLLAQRGELDLDAPVVDHWPEFGAEGKAAITVRDLLSHRAGLAAFDERISIEDFIAWSPAVERLAAQAPNWEPGTAHGYHALTYGFLVGEVIRRVTGRSVGAMVAEEIAGPRGLELWLGAPDDVAARAARLSAGDRTTPRDGAAGDTTAGDGAAHGGTGGDGGPGARPAGGPPGQGPGDLLYEMAKASLDPDSLMNRAMANPNANKLKGGANHPVILRAGWPAMGIVTTARGLAGFYRDLIAGDIIKPETLDDAMRRRVRGPDRVMIVDSSFGLGYMRPALTYLTPPKGAETAFGHAGFGGSLGLGDVRHGLALSYTMNRLAKVAGSLRAYHLAEAVYDSLT
jgi:CubicO group peptidase (beta-lactamase class C family)